MQKHETLDALILARISGATAGVKHRDLVPFSLTIANPEIGTTSFRKSAVASRYAHASRRHVT